MSRDCQARHLDTSVKDCQGLSRTVKPPRAVTMCTPCQACQACQAVKLSGLSGLSGGVKTVMTVKHIYKSELLLCSIGQQRVLKPVEHTLLTSTLEQAKQTASVHPFYHLTARAWSSRCSFSLAFVVCSIKHSNAQVLMVVHFVDDICYVGPPLC